MADLKTLQAELAKTRQLGKFITAWDPAQMGVGDPNPRTLIDGQITASIDVPIPVRDGTLLRGNIYRPLDQETKKMPVIFNYSVYGKDGSTDIAIFPSSSGLDPARLTQHYLFEAADPGWWCPRGYVVASVDGRGSFQSDGDKSYYSRDVGLDGYDLVEWLAEQPWSNGKVAMCGASGYAMVQWLTAAEHPPSLAAIVPVDGMTDIYREMAFKGGIPEYQFNNLYPIFFHWGRNLVEDTTYGLKDHPYFDEYWESKIPALANIECPAYIICSWGDHAIHTRGTLNAWKQISSKDKYLEIHQYQKWEWSVTEESLERQKAFLDHYLIGAETELKFWPKVRYAMRERYYVGEWRYSDEFPIPETKYTQFFPTPSQGLSTVARPAAQSVSYAAREGEIAWELPLRSSLEFAGHVKVKLWVEVADGGDNLDLFITLRKKDHRGKEVFFPWLTIVDTGPIGFGWLRASRRELDEDKSRAWQPIHLHRRDLEPLNTGDIVPLEIEIQPTSCRLRSGDTLSLVVSGHDYGDYPANAPIARHTETVNKGRHIIHFGGEYDSHLLLPVIPPQEIAYSNKKSLVKMTVMAKRFPGWSDDKFVEEYTGKHAEMTRKMAATVPILRNYTQLIALQKSDVQGLPDGGTGLWDAVTTLGWTSRGALWGSFQHPLYKATAGKHVFVDESISLGVLSQSFAEILFDPVGFKNRGKDAGLLYFALAKHNDTRKIALDEEGFLIQRTDAIRQLGAGTELLRYVINRKVTPDDTDTFFAGTPFGTADWTTVHALEQFWFPSRQAAVKFLQRSDILTSIFEKLPEAWDVTRSIAVLGDENIVVAKDLAF